MTVACQDPPVRTSSTAVPGLAGSQPSKWLGCGGTRQNPSPGPGRVRVTVNSLIGISLSSALLSHAQGQGARAMGQRCTSTLTGAGPRDKVQFGSQIQDQFCLCVPRVSSMALTSRVARPVVRP